MQTNKFRELWKYPAAPWNQEITPVGSTLSSGQCKRILNAQALAQVRTERTLSSKTELILWTSQHVASLEFCLTVRRGSPGYLWLSHVLKYLLKKAPYCHIKPSSNHPDWQSRIVAYAWQTGVLCSPDEVYSPPSAHGSYQWHLHCSIFDEPTRRVLCRTLSARHQGES